MQDTNGVGDHAFNEKKQNKNKSKESKEISGEIVSSDKNLKDNSAQPPQNETEKLRTWMDDQNVKFVEKRKEAKDKLCAAKDKEKSLQQKMLDDVAKAVIANEGVPLTTMEYDAIVSKIKIQE